MYSNPFSNQWNEDFIKSFYRNFSWREQQEETDTSSLFLETNCIKKSDDEQSYQNSELANINSVFENYSPKFELKNTKIFKVIYRKRISLFTILENDEIDSSTNDETFLGRKRFPEKRKRFENQDNMRKKIKRGFLNEALITNFNEILGNNENKNKPYLMKFPQDLVVNITKDTNKKLINMTLEQIFEKKELYKQKDLSKYYHNLKVIKSEEVQENPDLKAILNKKYYQLFEEYRNSKEFRIDEINRLKKKNMNDSYIERHIYLAKHFIEFFSE